jgi:DNA-3-methyladenine glycosylase
VTRTARRRRLPAAFYARPAEQVARDLLGAVLVSEIDGLETAGRIVETEAYSGPHDPASHAAARIGRTLRNAAMFGPPGTAYVYRSYGVHWCLNTVTDRTGFPAAVLIRALEPITGLDAMRRRRCVPRRAIADRELCNGPGKLAEALGITGALDGHPLERSPLRIVTDATVASEEIVATARVGITRAVDWPLRFYVRGSRWISRR